MALGKLMQEDPTFKVHTDTETGQTIIRGMGELHLEIIVDRMVREFNVGANIGKPQVAYREAITTEAQGARPVRPPVRRPRPVRRRARSASSRPSEGHEFVFDNEIRAASIPKEFIKPIEQGIKEAMETGVLAGYPTTGVHGRALRRLVPRRRLLRRWRSRSPARWRTRTPPRRPGRSSKSRSWTSRSSVPEDYMGDVIGDLNSRRGHIKHMEPRGGRPGHHGAGAALGDVRLLDEPAVDDPGPRQLLDAVRGLRRSSEDRQRRDHRQGRASK